MAETGPSDGSEYHHGGSTEVLLRGKGQPTQVGGFTTYPPDIVVRVEPGTRLTPELADEIRQLHMADPLQAAGRDPYSQGEAYGQGAGIVIDYVGAHPPDDAKASIEAAATTWEEALRIDVPIRVQLEWVDLHGFIGSASTGFASHPEFPLADIRYPTALANDFAGQDVNGSYPEVLMKISSSTDWYTGDGTEPFSGYDLETIALHELGHGLGFGLSGAASLNLWDYLLTTSDDKRACEIGDYDQYKTDPGMNVFVSDTAQMKVYSPVVFSGGSSLSHFDEASHPIGEFGSLMTPFQGSGVTDRDLDGAVLGPISEMGWRMRRDPAHPLIESNGFVGSSSYTVTWERGDISDSMIPDYYLVQLVGDGKLILAEHYVPETQRSYTFTNVSYPGLVRALVYGHFFNGGTNTQGLAYANDHFSVPDETVEAPEPSSTPDGVTSSPVCPPNTTEPEPSPPPPPSRHLPGYVRELPLDSQIYRLYKAYFLREPDERGFEFWLEAASRMPTAAVSDAFASSGEFEARYGALSDREFVNLVYENVLERQPDLMGGAFWVANLGFTHSRGSVMLGFSDSPEFVAKTNTVVAGSSEAGKVTRLYQGYFTRDPDEEGLQNWVSYLKQTNRLDSISEAFANSEEFTQRYGSLSDPEFVDLVYINVLGRLPDETGRNFWIDQLGAGKSRGAIMVGLTESSEFIIKTGTIR